ncbi:hypothetical protein MRX96_056487 [Rhipicephalus microplus]
MQSGICVCMFSADTPEINTGLSVIPHPQRYQRQHQRRHRCATSSCRPQIGFPEEYPTTPRAPTVSDSSGEIAMVEYAYRVSPFPAVVLDRLTGRRKAHSPTETEKAEPNGRFPAAAGLPLPRTKQKLRRNRVSARGITV